MLRFKPPHPSLADAAMAGEKLLKLSARAWDAESIRRALLSPFEGEACEFGYQGLRATDSIAISPLLPLSFIIACDYGLDTAHYDRELRFFSLERGKGVRSLWTHGALLDSFPEFWGREVKDYLTSRPHPVCLIPYRSTHYMEELSEAEGGRVKILANPVHLKNVLDDKRRFRAVMGELGLKIPPGYVSLAEDISFREGARRLGNPFVAQLPVASSGNGTFLVRDEAELRGLMRRLDYQGDLILNRYIHGYSLGMTACIYRGQFYMASPSVQLSGIADCSSHIFGYAGSDFAAFSRLVPPALKDKLLPQVERVGEWVAAQGYRGIFGVDFIVEGEELYAIEINPRLLGTTQLMTEAQLLSREVLPSVFLHLAEFLGVEVEVSSREEFNRATIHAELSGFQLFLRNTASTACRVEGEIEPGIYTLEGEGLKFLRFGRFQEELRDEEEFLLTCSVVPKGKVVVPGGVFLKLQSRALSAAPNLRDIDERTKTLVKIIRNALEIRPLEEVPS
ncbi:MAG: ATP-grasp domain-containing protein [Nitrospinota bacterium]